MSAVRQKEVTQKEKRISDLITKMGLDGVCLSRAINFAWFTGGGNNRVVTGSETGAAALVILGDRKYIVAPKNEIERFLEEQVPDLGFEPWTYEWYESREKAIADLVGSRKIGTDIPMGGWPVLGADLNRLRYSLTGEEIARAREIGAICSRELAATCVNISPGMTEWEVQAELSYRLIKYGVRPAVLLVGTDERAFKHRHPVPTDKRLDKYAIIGLVGEKDGLHLALTRSVYFGRLPEHLRRLYDVALKVEAAFLQASKVGAGSQFIFDQGREAYAAAGFPDEWQRHHQGGAIGYAPREYRAGEGGGETIQPNQMLAWNPTVQGTKCEDTVLVQDGGGLEFLTSVPGWWPVATLELGRQEVSRPLILER
ncbi:Metallopeptidase family M24 [Neomoorella glycerini]|uniref:Metallopeptidase family M24 n=1 Tax=Neomoorella glycerini TaxID=55779 RepID=A0A6I5ZMF9_9FIRM|nr:M24 family metallopeptidase [Moorella glycerini]QGP91048.1 Metallopeptidase family M24 [Moorella glycerini]